MFITIALRDLAPSTLILLRMGSGALALAVYVRLAGHRLSLLRPYAWPLALLALINTAVPFFLIAWGQQYIDSGLAAIFNASAPLFTALFALPIDRTQRVTGARLAGVVLAFARRRPPRRLRARRRRARRRRRAGRRRRLGLLRARRALRGPSLRRPASVARRLRVARLGDALRAPGRRRAGEHARLGVAALRALPRRRRDRRRVPALLRPDRRRGRVEGGARHLPGAVAGARLRRDLPGRDRDGDLARRASRWC